MRYFLVLAFVWMCHCAWGQEMAVYPTSYNAQSKAAFIYDIHVDSQAVAWFATGQGLLQKTINTDTLIQHPQKTYRSNFVTSIGHTKRSLYCGFFDGTVYRVENLSFSDSLFSTHKEVLALAAKETSVYAATTEAVWVYDFKTKKPQQLPLPSNVLVRDLALWNGGLYIATNSGLFVWKEAEAQQVQKGNFLDLSQNESSLLATTYENIWDISPSDNVTKRCSFDSRLAVNEVHGICVLPEWQQYILATNEGLVQIDWQGGVKQSTTRLSETGTAVNAIAKSGPTLWLGTYGDGIWYATPAFAPTYLSLVSQFHSSSNSWASLSKTGVLEKGTGTLFGSAGYQHSLPRLQDFCFKGDSILGIRGNQLYVVTAKGTGAITLPFEPETVLDMLAINRDTLAISVQYQGVYFYSMKKRSVVQQLTTKNGLLHNDIIQLLNTPEGLFFLSRESGISKQMPKGDWHYYTTANGLPSMENTAIAYDGKQIWISSEGGGLATLEDDRITKVTLTQSTEPEYYYGVLAKENGVWFYSRERVFQIKNQQLQSLPIPSFARSVVPFEGPLQYTADNIIIPCYTGHIAVPLQSFDVTNMYPAQYNATRVYSNLSGTFNNGESLPSGNHEITIRIHKQSKYPNHYDKIIYQLEGYHTQWQSTSGAAITIPSVRSGNYRLLIKDYDRTLSILQFEVAIPIWRRPWFVAIALILIGLLYVLLIRFRTQRLKAQNAALEALVAERTKDLAERNTELQQFTYAISHDLKNPAANINFLVEAIHEDFKDELSKEVQLYLKQLAKAGNKLYSNLLDLLEVLKNVNAGELPKENVSISKVIEGIKDEISSQIEACDAKIQVDLPHFDTLYYNKVNLHSVLYNLISNGIKYRREDTTPKVKIQSFENKGYLGLTISDNGLGMDLEANKEMLFGLFKRFHDHVEGSGVGLYLVNAVVEKNGGRIEVDSTVGKGTTFTLYLVPKTP